MITTFLKRFIKAICFPPFHSGKFEKKEAVDYLAARQQKLSLFIKLKEDLEKDIYDISSTIWEKEEEIEAIKLAIDSLKKSIDDLEQVKTDNQNTISQISLFV
jgi:chromosome segregation ATPase